MAYAVTGGESDRFFYEGSREGVHDVFMAILEAAVTTVDANMLRWVQETALQQTALIWKEATLNTCCNYEAPVGQSVDCLYHLTAMCILKNKCHNVQYFLLSFLRRNQIMKRNCANFISF
jgi:hypothetical protein